jgi:hypothetical protein
VMPYTHLVHSSGFFTLPRFRHVFFLFMVMFVVGTGFDELCVECSVVEELDGFSSV